jgi:hypothetical protein
VVRLAAGLAGVEDPHSLDRGRPLRTLAAFATVTAKPGRAAEARLAIAARAFAR